MAKAPNTPIKLVIDTANTKLIGPIKGKFTGGTTYSPVGPSCPTTCLFHPVSERASERPAGFKSCYATKGHVRFSTTEKAYVGATFDGFGLLRVRARIDAMLGLHIAGDRIIDIFRWHTGGDILHPHTGEVWSEHVDLICDTAVKFMDVGVPLIGFTACWQMAGAQPLKHIFLASVPTREDAQLALSMGWHVAWAVVTAEYEEALAFLRSLGEVTVGCTEQTGKSESCAQCGWCAHLDPERIHMHKYQDYMMYRKRNKIIGLAGSVLFIVHN
jgi:hypothetical protein